MDYSIIMFFTILKLIKNVTIVGRTRALILSALAEESLHGYELARRLNLPVTGIYQHLKALSRDKLIVDTESGRRRVYSLTKKGRALVAILEGGN